MESKWTGLVKSLTPKHRFAFPASCAEIAEAEQQLKATFPDDLRELLLETNGVWGEYDLGLVWPIERIVEDNLVLRRTEAFKDLYMPFDPLLFFADAGNGDQFAFRVLSRSVRRAEVYAWNHENDSRLWVAPSLAMYLEWWLNGTLKL